MPNDCPTYCGPAKTQFGLQPPPPPSTWAGRIAGYFGQPDAFPLLADLKNYLSAVEDAGHFRVDAAGHGVPLAYTFLCTYRPGTTLYHGTPNDFTNLGRVRVLRGGFYTSSLAYARFLLWKTLSAPQNQDNPRNAVILEYGAPAGSVLFVNNRLYTGQMIASAGGTHGVVNAGTYPNGDFSAAQNFAQHAKIFCNSAVNYGVANLVGAIQGIGATDLEVGGMLEPFLVVGPLTPDNLAQRQRNFRALCAAIGGLRGVAIEQNWARAVPHLVVTNRATLAQFDELYWNDRPNPARRQLLYTAPAGAPPGRALRRTGSSPDLRGPPLGGAAPPAPNIDRLAEYGASFLALVRGDTPGYQYCFDYRTYGPMITTPDAYGNPSPVTVRACLTPLRRPRLELNALADTILDRLNAHCQQGIKKNLYVSFRNRVDQSSHRALTHVEIDDLRRYARLLNAQLF